MDANLARVPSPTIRNRSVIIPRPRRTITWQEVHIIIQLTRVIILGGCNPSIADVRLVVFDTRGVSPWCILPPAQGEPSLQARAVGGAHTEPRDYRLRSNWRH